MLPLLGKFLARGKAGVVGGAVAGDISVRAGQADRQQWVLVFPVVLSV